MKYNAVQTNVYESYKKTNMFFNIRMLLSLITNKNWTWNMEKNFH
jgi:hypothetical protein